MVLQENLPCEPCNGLELEIPVQVLRSCLRLKLGHDVFFSGLNYKQGSVSDHIKLHAKKLKKNICFDLQVPGLTEVFQGNKCIVSCSEEVSSDQDSTAAVSANVCGESSNITKTTTGNKVTRSRSQPTSRRSNILPAGQTRDIFQGTSSSVNWQLGKDVEKDQDIVQKSNLITDIKLEHADGRNQLKDASSMPGFVADVAPCSVKDQFCVVDNNSCTSSSNRIRIENETKQHINHRFVVKNALSKCAKTGKSAKSKWKLNKGSHSCDNCSMSFKTVHGLNKHKSLKHAVYHYSNPLRCPFCKTMFPSARKRKMHQFYKCTKNQNISRTLHICSLCDKPFQTNNQRSNHMQRAHNVDVQLSCEQCEATFSKASHLRTHMIRVHLETTEYTCPECGKMFAYKTLLTRHMTSHVQANLCPMCGKSFKNRRAVNVHIGTAHKKVWPYKCDNCEKCFKLQKKMEYHVCSVVRANGSETKEEMKGDIVPEEIHHCRLCDVIKRTTSLLYKHVMERHQDHPQFTQYRDNTKASLRVQCEACGLDFATTSNLNKHRRLKNCNNLEESQGIKSGHPCPFCAKIGSSLTHLAKHLKKIHQFHPEYETEHRRLRTLLTAQCEVCGNWYPDKSSCRQHYINTHAQDVLRCSHCSKPFKSQVQMQKHIDHTHLGLSDPTFKSSRRYFRTCKQCPKSFVGKDQLEEHVKLEHVNKKQVHQCDKCQFVYNTPRQYYLHNQKVHSSGGFSCPGCGAGFQSRHFLNKHKRNCFHYEQMSKTKQNRINNLVHVECLTLKRYVGPKEEVSIKSVSKTVQFMDPTVPCEEIQVANDVQLMNHIVHNENVESATIENIDVSEAAQRQNVQVPDIMVETDNTEVVEQRYETDGEVVCEQILYFPPGTSLNHLTPEALVTTVDDQPDTSNVTYYQLT